MRKVLILAFMMFSVSAFSEELISVEGIIDSIEEDIVKIRAPKEDIVLSFQKLNKDLQAKLINEKNSKSKTTFTFNESALIERKNTFMGIRANCSEIPTNINELVKIADESSDMLSFLKAIPEGTLQGFTFVTNSLSLHRGKKDENGDGQVSPMWPRVLRSSVDGKMTISFVCDPKNPTFGKVEIIHFDDKDKTFKTVEFDFGHPSLKPVTKDKRIHHNPESCISCHSGSEINGKKTLKPNWPEYFQWSDCEDNRGIQIYGGNDDNMSDYGFRKAIKKYEAATSCSEEKLRASTVKEQTNYLKFKELQKNNECFNSLPWPDRSKKDDSFESRWTYKFYPYADRGRQEFAPSGKKYDIDKYGLFNYSLRTNLRFTDTYSHLMSQQIAHNLKQNPDYDGIKYLLVMEQAQCFIGEDELQNLNKILKGFKYDAHYNGNSNLDKFSLLAQFSKSAGLKPVDWTMAFQEKENSNYISAMPHYRGSTYDLEIHHAVGGEILKDIDADLAKKFLTRGVEEVFGPKFSCLDDLGGGIQSQQYYDPQTFKPIKKSLSMDSELCKKLRNNNKLNFIKLRAARKDSIGCENCKENLAKSDDPIINIIKTLNVDQVARGKKLIEADSKGKCVTCHSSSIDLLPRNFRFIPSEFDKNKAESLAIIQARKDEIGSKIEHRLIKTKTMPPGENDLSDEDRQDIKAYLLSLIFE